MQLKYINIKITCNVEAKKESETWRYLNICQNSMGLGTLSLMCRLSTVARAKDNYVPWTVPTPFFVPRLGPNFLLKIGQTSPNGDRSLKRNAIKS
jgi:hypothetical protein